MKRKVLQCTKDEQPVRLWSSIREAEQTYHITHVSMVCRGKRRSDGGYIWHYIEDSGAVMPSRVIPPEGTQDPE